MRKLVYLLIVSIISIYLSAGLFGGVNYSGWSGLFAGAGILALLCLLLRPLIMVVVLPFNLLTFGLVGLLVNAWLFHITDWILGDFSISGFWNALGAAVILFIIDRILHRIFSHWYESYSIPGI